MENSRKGRYLTFLKSGYFVILARFGQKASENFVKLFFLFNSSTYAYAKLSSYAQEVYPTIY